MYAALTVKWNYHFWLNFLRVPTQLSSLTHVPVSIYVVQCMYYIYTYFMRKSVLPELKPFSWRKNCPWKSHYPSYNLQLSAFSFLAPSPPPSPSITSNWEGQNKGGSGKGTNFPLTSVICVRIRGCGSEVTTTPNNLHFDFHLQLQWIRATISTLSRKHKTYICILYSWAPSV